MGEREPDIMSALDVRRERSDRMLTEIGLGLPKASSRTIRTAADAALWAPIAADVERITAAGHVVGVYGYRAAED